MNRYCIDLNLPNFPKTSVKKFINEQFSIPENKRFHWQNSTSLELEPILTTEFLSWLKSMKINVYRIELFQTGINSTSDWHSDMYPLKEFAKLNWVYEEGVSYFEYGKIPENFQPKELSNRLNTPYCPFPKNTELAYRTNLKGPALINAGIPHRVCNMKNTVRWAISIIPFHSDTNTRVLWDDALEIFKDYIV